MSERDIASVLRKMERLKVAPEEDAESRHLLARIETAFAMARGETRFWLTSMLAEVDAALDRQDAIRLKQLRTDIHQALNLIEADHVR